MFDPDKCVISKSSCEVILLQSLLDIYIQRTVERINPIPGSKFEDLEEFKFEMI